eukprot:scaffold135348_cov50-Prasinocladus_malaysianus.AAC.2
MQCSARGWEGPGVEVHSSRHQRILDGRGVQEAAEHTGPRASGGQPRHGLPAGRNDPTPMHAASMHLSADAAVGNAVPYLMARAWGWAIREAINKGLKGI